jgi:hypothetical protein
LCPVRSAKSRFGSASWRPGWTVWPAPGHSRFRCRASPRCVARVRCRPGARKVMAPRGAEKYPALGWREPCPSMPVRPTGGAPHGGAQDVTRTRGHGKTLPNECSWDALLGRLATHDGGWHMSSREPNNLALVPLGGDCRRVISHLVALATNHQAPHASGCGLCAYALSLRDDRERNAERQLRNLHNENYD